MSVPVTSDIPTSMDAQPTAADNERRKAMSIITNRYNDKLTTLPKEKGWLTENLRLYEGFWQESIRVISVVTLMASQDSFQAQPTDIYVATLQKAGTTWLKALAFAIVSRTRYKNSSLSSHPLQTLNPHKCVPYIEMESLRTLPSYADGQSPRLFSTHIPYTSLPQSILDNECRVVYMCRNPKDVFVSLFHYANKLRDKSLAQMRFEEAFEMFSNGLIPGGPYWDHVKGYYKAAIERPSKILFLTYEDMQKDSVNNVKRLAEFMGYPFTEEEEIKGVVQEIVALCSFENMREVNKHGILAEGVRNDVFFREGKTGDWTNHLTNEMSQILDQITKEKFDGLDISF
ncbi:hypothetical protein Lser_V15G26273 [Lactuca serriola]